MAPQNTSSAVPRTRKRRWTREQLLAQLKMIGELDAPLPPTLPPSPPVSRAPSPAAGFKRKLEPSSDPDAVKRPRTNLSTDRSQTTRHLQPTQQQAHTTLQYHSQHHLPSHPPPPPQPTLRPNPPIPASRLEPCEDGEVREEPAALSTPYRAPATTADVPIRRPKKGKLSQQHFDTLHDKYHAAGRVLKYSGDARFWSTYPSSSRDYKPLHDPPPPSSPYHKHGGLIARLELVDALICFTYSIWSKDFMRHSCNKDTWGTIEAFLGWCKQKWAAEEASNDAEKAFLGLIWMIEGFIQGRKIYYTVKSQLHADIGKVHENISKKIALASSTSAEGDPGSAATFALLNGKAPPMLPSPSSTNSTPVNREDGTPNSAASAKRPVPAAAHAASRQTQYTGSVPLKQLPQMWRENPASIPPHLLANMEAVTEPISPTLVQNLKDMTTDYLATAWAMQSARQYLHLPVLRRCFPKTWARMMYSTLVPNDEAEPDFEDEEGELFWPDQCMNGDGIGWVCLMGKAMVKEFGAAYGYKGLEGVVPKPKPEESQAIGRRQQQLKALSGYGASVQSSSQHRSSASSSSAGPPR